MAERRPLVSIPEDLTGPPTTALAVIPTGDTIPLDVLPGAGVLVDDGVLFFDPIAGSISTDANFTFDAVTALLRLQGTYDIIHTALAADDHAFEIDVNAAGFGDVKAIDIVYITGAINLGQDEAIILANIDESAALGGDVSGLQVLATEGLANIFGLFAGINVNPIEQLSGSFGDMDSALVNATDRLTEFTTAGNDVQMFVADNDTVTIGNATKFVEIEFLLAIVASGGGIAPVFEFSTGVGTWDVFTPVDGTNGMRNNGVIAWLEGDIPTWAVGTGGEFLIRITRTRNTLATPPTESKVQIAGATEYSWNKDGDLDVRDISARDIAVTGLVDGVDIAAHVADGTIHFTEASISHLNIQDIGTNSHAAIDTHIADGTIHFTEASIAHDNLDAGASPPIAAHVPAGGAAGQVLEKIDGTDYNTQWATPASMTFALALLQARDTTNQTVGTTWADVTLNTTDHENEAATIEHNNTNTDDIDIKVAGYYKIDYHVNIQHVGSPNTNTLLQGRMRLNDAGTGIAGSLAETTVFQDGSIEGDDVETILSASFYLNAAASDKITLQLQYVDISGTGTPGIETDEVSIKVTQLFRT